MTQKLLLAEGLDLLRQCEIREYEMDRTRDRMSGSAKYRSELVKLIQGYDIVYQQYVRGVEILNLVRRNAIADTNPKNLAYNKNLIDFCAGKMTAYMDRCDNIVRKQDGILVPIDQVSALTKDGFTPMETMFIQDGAHYPLTRKEKFIAKEFTLLDGTYILYVKNLDDYSIAAPDVTITLNLIPQRGVGAEPLRVERELPCQCGWRKLLGVVGSATLQLEVRAGGLRDAHIDILLQKLGPAADGDAAADGPGASPFRGDNKNNFAIFDEVTKQSAQPAVHSGGGRPPAGQEPPAVPSGGTAGGGAPWVQQLPPLPDDELTTLANYNVPSGSLPNVRGGGREAPAAAAAAPSARVSAEDPWLALEHLNVPHVGHTPNRDPTRVPERIEVDPAGLTCQQRLDKLLNMINVWPSSGVMAVPLPPDAQRGVQAVLALPLPRDLA